MTAILPFVTISTLPSLSTSGILQQVAGSVYYDTDTCTSMISFIS